MSVVEKTAIQVGVGAVAGVVSGLKNAPAPHSMGIYHGIGAGAANASSNFFNAATKSMHKHHKFWGALGAGATAVVGHGALAAVATAAAVAVPVVIGVAAVGGAAVGTVKLAEYLRKKV
jgi:hypothetical protein